MYLFLMCAGDGAENLLLPGPEAKDLSQTHGDGPVPLSPAPLGRTRHPRRVHGCRRRFWCEVDKALGCGDDENVCFCRCPFFIFSLDQILGVFLLSKRV